ncbi:hypothetical protein CHISP_3438 [Chitinispirillum alkaliphilum]|nr:hypothetical protein CHISP_3438 [Chitinispirillum alkaliphilum]
MGKSSFALPVLIVIILSGCTHISVLGPREQHQIDHVFIRENPQVIIRDFSRILQDGFSRHGIASDVILHNFDPGDAYIVTYTARQSWDFTTYLSYAEVRIEKEGKIIASATYRLRGKGGLSFRKWASARSKMKPVIDQLVDSFRRDHH